MPCRHRGWSKGLAPLIRNLHVRWRWVINATTPPLYPREGTHGRDAGWAPEPVRTGAHKRKSLVPARVRAVNLPSRSESLCECAIPARPPRL